MTISTIELDVLKLISSGVHTAKDAASALNRRMVDISAACSRLRARGYVKANVHPDRRYHRGRSYAYSIDAKARARINREIEIREREIRILSAEIAILKRIIQ